MSSITFLVQTCTSDLPPPPSQWRSTLPPIHTWDPLLCMGINRKADVRACRLPWGVPSSWRIFKFCHPCIPLPFKHKRFVNHGIFSPPTTIYPPPQSVSEGNSFYQMDHQADTLSKASERGHPGMCIVDNNHMYPLPTFRRTLNLLPCHRCPG